MLLESCEANSGLPQGMGLIESAPNHVSSIVSSTPDAELMGMPEEQPSEMRLGWAPLPAPPPGTVTTRWDLPVCLADAVIGLDGIFLIHVLFTVRPTCPGINVRLLESPRLKNK